MKIRKFNETSNAGPAPGGYPRPISSDMKKKAEDWDKLKSRIDQHLNHFLQSADGGCLDGRSIDQYLEDEGGCSELEHIALLVADAYGYLKYNQ